MFKWGCYQVKHNLRYRKLGFLEAWIEALAWYHQKQWVLGFSGEFLGYNAKIADFP